MSSEDQISEQLRVLTEKVDKIALAVEQLTAAKRKRNEAKRARAKPPPLTEDEIATFQGKFRRLFERFTANEQTAVQEELEAMTPEDLRRFADANNLNVTSKTSKARVIQLIGFRFREKRQLTAPVGEKRPSDDSSKAEL